MQLVVLSIGPSQSWVAKAAVSEPLMSGWACILPCLASSELIKCIASKTGILALYMHFNVLYLYVHIILMPRCHEHTIMHVYTMFMQSLYQYCFWLL